MIETRTCQSCRSTRPVEEMARTSTIAYLARNTDVDERPWVCRDADLCFRDYLALPIESLGGAL